MNTKIRTKTASLQPLWLALVGLGLPACNPGAETGSSAQSDASDLVASLFMDEAPTGALSVGEGRTQLSPGDEAILVGQIGGVEAPFLSGYAGFVLADSALLFCGEMSEDDHCATPWDACCEDIERRKAHRVSVQFVDAEGTPLEADLTATSDLKGLDHVVVVGTVATTSTPDNMIVNAKKMAVVAQP